MHRTIVAMTTPDISSWLAYNSPPRNKIWGTVILWTSEYEISAFIYYSLNK
jgi:hypothetical protein